jgi:long-chain acyl-CoA synthetase
MIGDNERILITGATGFLGREVLKNLLRDRPGARVVLLVRGGDRAEAVVRGQRVVRHVTDSDTQAEALGRLEILPADLAADGCGLDPADREAAVAGTTAIIHAAAAVSFDQTVAEARHINVEGTRQILALAEDAARRGTLRSFGYLSTAFVAGRRSGLVREDELDVGQQFRNAYEKTKCEAETLVRSCADRLPIRIFRPSIVVGSSDDGSTSSFKMIYWPLRVYATRRWRLVPGYADTVVDLIPVDFVARAIASLVFDDRAAGRTFHLCAGPEGAATAGEIARFAAEFFALPPPRFVNPVLFEALIRPIGLLLAPRGTGRILREGHVYRPYFRMHLSFDTTGTRELLEPAGMQVPRVVDYLERVFRYCRDSNWGRRPVAREADRARTGGRATT